MPNVVIQNVVIPPPDVFFKVIVSITPKTKEREREEGTVTFKITIHVHDNTFLSLSKRSHTTSHVNTVYVPISLFHHMWISYLGKAANWPHKLYLTDTSVDTHSHIHTYTLSLPSVYLCTLSLPLPMYSFSSSTYVLFLFPLPMYILYFTLSHILLFLSL